MRKAFMLFLTVFAMQIATYADTLTSLAGATQFDTKLYAGSNLFIKDTGGGLEVYFVDENGISSSANGIMTTTANDIVFGVDFDLDGKEDILALTSTGVKVYTIADGGGSLSNPLTVISGRAIYHAAYVASANKMVFANPTGAVDGTASHVFLGATTAHRESVFDNTSPNISQNGLAVTSFIEENDVMGVIGDASTINFRLDDASHLVDTTTESGNGSIQISNGDQYDVRSFDFADVIGTNDKDDMILTHNTTAAGYDGVFLIAGNASHSSLTPTVNSAHRDVWISNDIDSKIPYAKYATIGDNTLIVISWSDGSNAEIEFYNPEDIPLGDVNRSAIQSSNVFDVQLSGYSELHFKQLALLDSDQVNIIFSEDNAEYLVPFDTGRAVTLASNVTNSLPGEAVSFILSTDAAHDTGFYVNDVLVSSNTATMDYTFVTEGTHKVYTKARNWLTTKTSDNVFVTVAYPTFTVSGNANSYTQSIRDSQTYTWNTTVNLNNATTTLSDISLSYSGNTVSIVANSTSPYEQSGSIALTSIHGQTETLSVDWSFVNSAPTIAALTSSVTGLVDDEFIVNIAITDPNGTADINGYTISSNLLTETQVATSSSGNTNNYAITMRATAAGNADMYLYGIDAHGATASATIPVYITYPDLEVYGNELLYSYTSSSNVTETIYFSQDLSSVSATGDHLTTSFSANALTFTHDTLTEGTYGIGFTATSNVGTTLTVATQVQVLNVASPVITNLTPATTISQADQAGNTTLQFVITDTDDNVNYATLTLNSIPATTATLSDNVYNIAIETTNLELGDHIYVIQVQDSAGYVGQAISSITIQATTSEEIVTEYETPEYVGADSWRKVSFAANVNALQLITTLSAGYGTLGTTTDTDWDILNAESSGNGEVSYKSLSLYTDEELAAMPVLGRGFYITTTNAVTKNFGFTSAGSQEISYSLEEGWNLIGNPYGNALHTDDYKIDGISVKSDENTASGHHLWFWSSSADEYISLSGEIPSGIAVWLYSNSEQTLTFGPYDPNAVRSKARAKTTEIDGTPMSEIDMSSEPQPPTALSKAVQANTAAASSGGGGGGCLLK